MPTVRARKLIREVGLESAKLRGFVLTTSKGHVHHLDYRRWCRESRVPFIHVRKFRRNSVIHLDCETSGYPPVYRLDDAGWSSVWEAVERIGLKYRTQMVGGECFMTIIDIPNERAEEIAAILRGNLTPCPQGEDDEE